MIETGERVIFPDKKEAHVRFQRITDHIKEASAIRAEMDVSQEEATWNIDTEYPDLPIAVVFMTDIHYGNSGTDYDLLLSHLNTIETTPNMKLLLGGDIVDNFSAAKHPVAMNGDVISPQMQTQAFMAEIRRFDEMGKIGAICHGNHEAFMDMAGYDFYQSFMQGMKAPIFSKGGIIHVNFGEQSYQIGWNHTHWGGSKINVTNAGKRALEYSYPGSDIILLGHDHQASAELLDRNGQRKLVIDGGTYKLFDATGKKWGLGQAGTPGYTIMLWPDQHKFDVVSDPETAKGFIEALAYLKVK